MSMWNHPNRCQLHAVKFGQFAFLEQSLLFGDPRSQPRNLVGNIGSIIMGLLVLNKLFKAFVPGRFRGIRHHGKAKARIAQFLNLFRIQKGASLLVV